MPPKLISVHFPKAAGSSLANVYEAALGAGRLLRDYAHDPVDPCALMYLDPVRYEQNKPVSLDPYAAVHGHFHISRYDRLAGAVRVTVLREPVENFISIYYFWDHLRRQGRTDGHALYQYFCSSQLTLLELASIPALRTLMTGKYFFRVDMGCFDVIGDASNLDDYWRRVAGLIGVDFAALPKSNVTPPSDERQATSEDPHTLARLRTLLADDLCFYERYGSR